jgi:DNA-binding response OmpR family regulator
MVIPEAVLVFDRDADTVEMYGVGLELAGFRACLANDDAQAFALLRAEHPSAVIAGVGPEADTGWELIRSVRANNSTRDIPVVLLTGRTDPWIGRRAAELGCAALLVMPCLPDTLAAVVRQSLETSAS